MSLASFPLGSPLFTRLATQICQLGSLSGYCHAPLAPVTAIEVCATTLNYRSWICSAAPDWERGTLRIYINGIGRFIISFNNIIVIRLNVLAYTSNEWQVQQTGWDEQRFQVRNPSRPPSRIYWRDDSGEGVIFEVGGLAIMVWARYRRLEINVSKNCGAGSKWEGVLRLLIQPSYAENTCHKERIFRMYQVYKPCWLPLRILYYFTFIYFCSFDDSFV